MKKFGVLVGSGQWCLHQAP